jgi:DNA-binding NarL/FixJ family response regulator
MASAHSGWEAGAALARGTSCMQAPRRSQPGRSRLSELTPRELQVLEIMATGARDREIAEQLGIAVPTAKLHLHRVYSKLDVTNRVEAARHYLDHRDELGRSDAS